LASHIAKGDAQPEQADREPQHRLGAPGNPRRHARRQGVPVQHHADDERDDDCGQAERDPDGCKQQFQRRHGGESRQDHPDAERHAGRQLRHAVPAGKHALEGGNRGHGLSGMEWRVAARRS
jgi:hypothetical protein